METVALPMNQTAGISEKIHALSNDGMIIELIQTLNHLSRWLTPIHDRTRLEASAHRSSPSVKDILIGWRDAETRVFSFINAIASETNPDLDKVSRLARTPEQVQSDRESNALVLMSEFRRIRESSTSLLRALPDNAWERSGFSRTDRNWTIRELAEFLATNDWAQLRTIDRILSANGARQDIAAVSRVSLEMINERFEMPVGRG